MTKSPNQEIDRQVHRCESRKGARWRSLRRLQEAAFQSHLLFWDQDCLLVSLPTTTKADESARGKPPLVAAPRRTVVPVADEVDATSQLVQSAVRLVFSHSQANQNPPALATGRFPARYTAATIDGPEK